MSTLAEIQTAVQRQFGDDTEAQITLTDITRWANEAQLQIARKTDTLLETVIIPTVIGTSEYALPVDFLRVDRVLYDGKVIYKTTSQDLDALNPSRNVTPVPTGVPTRFIVKRKKIVLYPAPDSVKNVSVDIVTRPATLAVAGDIPEIPVELHPDIIRFCLARAYELDGQRVEARETMAELEQNLGWAMDETNNAYTDSYPMIREV